MFLKRIVWFWPFSILGDSGSELSFCMFDS